MDAPIISSEGLLRLVELVDRLKARDLDEGDASWTATAGACSPDGGGSPGSDAVGGAAGAEPSGGRAVTELADEPGADEPARRRGRG